MAGWLRWMCLALAWLLPPGAGSKQVVVENPPWLAAAEMLVRKL